MNMLIRLMLCGAALQLNGPALSQAQYPESVCKGTGVARAGEATGGCRDQNCVEDAFASGDVSVACAAKIVVTAGERWSKSGDGGPGTSAGEGAGLAKPAGEGTGDPTDAAHKVLETVGECVGRRFKKCR